LIKIGDSWVELPDGTFRVWNGKDWVGFNPGAKGAGKRFTFTKTAAKHFKDIVAKNGWHNGKAARPYMDSSLTIREIMSTGKGMPDATFKGGMNWKVSGTFRGVQGKWELGVNPKTNIIYHFLFKPL